MPYSVSEMFVTHGIPSFYKLLLKCFYRILKRINSSRNSIIILFFCQYTLYGTLFSFAQNSTMV